MAQVLMDDITGNRKSLPCSMFVTKSPNLPVVAMLIFNLMKHTDKIFSSMCNGPRSEGSRSCATGRLSIQTVPRIYALLSALRLNGLLHESASPAGSDPCTSRLRCCARFCCRRDPRLTISHGPPPPHRLATPALGPRVYCSTRFLITRDALVTPRPMQPPRLTRLTGQGSAAVTAAVEVVQMPVAALVFTINQKHRLRPPRPPPLQQLP